MRLEQPDPATDQNRDLSDKWDYWAYVELPIDEVRRRLNISPKA